MANVSDLRPPELLTSVLGKYGTTQSSEDRPFVTLTFAQSIDAKIAGRQGKQLILSGKESMIMTHWMRTMHDAILVGIGTALNDNPQLNTRHLPPTLEGTQHLPRPVIVDTHLRLSPDCKLLCNYRNGQGRRPWVLCDSERTEERLRRRETLEKAGAIIIEIPHPELGTRMSVKAILASLRQKGIHSLMVEGGAQIIASFMESSSAEKPLVDTVIVTVAPIFVGVDGIGYQVQDLTTHLRYCRTEKVGRDAVMILTTSNE